uniref:Methyltransferase NSUN7-like n=1 Tax=Saccoglossus kowalevskii TaxID=10224 RepID=A0ABM0LUA4_SACKO|nr:PREDICTED: putative methyltransferase NSUN7-like [Saccoglossus kowalevskii]
MSLYTENRSAYGRPLNSSIMATMNGLNRSESVPITVIKQKDMEVEVLNENGHQRTQSFHIATQPNGKESNQTVYLYASQLYASLKPKIKSERLSDNDNWCQGAVPPQIPPHEEKYRRLVYDLAFATLKYQALLEDILLDSGYYSSYSTPDENHALTMVILQDMQDRRFRKRYKKVGETLIEHVNEVEEDLNSYKTKFNAALARNRIKFKAPSIEYLLPEQVRQRETKAVDLPVYAWVNQIKTSTQTVIETLKEEGFYQVMSDDKLSSTTFYLDTQCKNIIVFHPDLRLELESHELVQDFHLILQDKASCFGPHSVKALLNEGDDIIHTHVGSGKITAHLSSLTNQDSSTVFAFGINSPSHHNAIREKMESFGAKNVRGVEENFLDVLPTDIRFKNVKVVLLTPPCSHSGITNPVDYILHDGEDTSILQDLSKDEIDQDKVDELINLQMDYLKHAVKFSKVQAVVYCTHSTSPHENENVVTKVSDYTNARLTLKQMPWRITPPTLPIPPSDVDTYGKQRYFKTEPSSKISGCFVCVITREATADDQLTAADIIARAKAKGLMGLDGEKIDTEDEEPIAEIGKRKKKGGQRSPRSKSTSSIRRVFPKGKISPPGRALRVSPTRSQRKVGRSKTTLIPNTSSDEDFRTIKTVTRKPRTATHTAISTSTITIRPKERIGLKFQQFSWQKF